MGQRNLINILIQLTYLNIIHTTKIVSNVYTEKVIFLFCKR